MQKAFSPIHTILLLVIVGIIGFTGWYVYNSQQKTDSSLNQANDQQIAKPVASKKDEPVKTFELPDGWQWYENKELGFKFAYPNEYSPIAKADSYYNTPVSEIEDYKTVYLSQNPKKEYAPGTSGKIETINFKSTDTVIDSRKYGPKIKLVNGKWIVIEEFEGDISANKKGTEYKDIFNDNKSIPETQVNGLKIFSIKSGDEGCFRTQLAFIVKQNLYQIVLPGYCDGLYGGAEGSKENDPTKYEYLYKTLLSSIQSL